eukprot:1527886-Prymnesium_polylepis.1
MPSAGCDGCLSGWRRLGRGRGTSGRRWGRRWEGWLALATRANARAWGREAAGVRRWSAI